MHVYEARPRKAPPLGRALRILIGLALIAYVTPVFFRVPLRFTVEVTFADAWVDWPLQRLAHCCFATHRRFRLLPRRGRSGGIARGTVCYWRPWLTDFWPR